MKIADYFKLLRRSWLPLLACLVVGVAAGVLATQLATKQYEAESRIFVSAQAGTTATDLLQSNSFAQQRVKSYADVVTSRSVLVPVASRFRVRGGASALAKRVTATVPLDTVLIRINVTDTDPGLAASIANAIAQEFKSVVSTLELPTSNGGSSVRVSIVEGAQPPGSASSPNPVVNVISGALIALALGWIAVVARNALDTRLKSAEELGLLTELPGLAQLPKARRGGATLFAQDGHPAVVHAEAYRQLRTNLQFASIDNPPRSIVVTSSIPAEGKTTVTTNVAATLAETGARVVLVDADLRRPTCARYLGLNEMTGVVTVLTGNSTVEAALQQWGDSSLYLLAAGGTPPNPSELLSSEAMRRMLLELADEFDYVLIDTPPLLPVTDAAILAGRADGVLFVSRRGVVKRAQIERAIASLRAVDAHLLGTIVNCVPSSATDEYGYYGSYAPLVTGDATKTAAEV